VVNDVDVDLSGSPSDATAADDVVAAIETTGGTALADHHSVADANGGKALVAATLEKFGRVDIIVNNAGILRDASFAKLDQQAWTAVLRVHLDGAFHVTSAAWPHLRGQSHGRIVVTTSPAALSGNFGQANYAAAKAGLIGLIRTLAVEGSKYNIKANAISPVASTRMTQGILSEEQKAALDPAYVSAAVVMLAAEQCPVNGEVIIAGGGTYGTAAYAYSRGIEVEEVPSPTELLERWGEASDMTAPTLARLRAKALVDQQ
jgi:NAD(P)-dependent dehydrogenase (short-subunit alcohol dehydrogenase family)